MIWLNISDASEFLFRNRTVYTLHPKQRREGHGALFWDRPKKRGLGIVRFIEEISNLSELVPFVPYSGFKTLKEWLEGSKGYKYLYKLILSDGERSWR
ncbi:MAG: hypothetical protein ACFFA1_08730 [Promethearchaeota archaeon]